MIFQSERNVSASAGHAIVHQYSAVHVWRQQLPVEPVHHPNFGRSPIASTTVQWFGRTTKQWGVATGLGECERNVCGSRADGRLGCRRGSSPRTGPGWTIRFALNQGRKKPTNIFHSSLRPAPKNYM